MQGLSCYHTSQLIRYHRCIFALLMSRRPRYKSNQSRSSAPVIRGADDTMMTPGIAGFAPTSTPVQDAVNISIVYACIKVIRETIASCSYNIYGVDGDERYKDSKHPLKALLKKPNQYNTYSQLIHLIVTSYESRGRGFWLILRDKYGNPTSLHWRSELKMKPVAYKGEIFFEDKELNKTFANRDVIYLADLWDSDYLGKGKLEMHMNTTGKLKASDDMINKLATNGLYLGAAVIYPDQFRNDDTVNRLEKTFKEKYKRGVASAGDVAFLTGNARIEQFKMSMNLTDAQIIPFLQMSKEDICSIFSTPPPKVGILGKATYNNIEHLQIDFIQSGILPVVKLLEEQINDKLFLPKDHGKKVFKIELDSLLRADTLTTIQALSQAIASALLNPDEARAILNRNPIPGGHGQKFWLPTNNLSPIDQPQRQDGTK